MSDLAEWFTFGAEMIVAGVLYLEFERNRRMKFIEQATDRNAMKDRLAVYKAFCALPDSSVSARSRTFAEHLKGEAGEAVRAQCEAQLSLLNAFGFETSRWFSFNRDLRHLFPHGPVRMGIILHQYLGDELSRSGPLNARHAMSFILRCIDIVRETRASITISYGGRDIPIEDKDLEALKADLEQWTTSSITHKGSKIRKRS